LLSAAIATIMHSPAVSGVLEKSGSEVVASTAVEFAAVINRDSAKYGKLSDAFETK
jgi:tripartite-type tricarboxylate transporter receptor subunit TctC